MRAAVSDGLPLAAADLPEGAITWLGGVEGRLFAQVHGEGLWLSVTGGDSFRALSNPPVLPGSLSSLLNPRGNPAPFGIDGSNDMLADVGADLWAVTQLADSMLPTHFTGLLSGTVFHSTPPSTSMWASAAGTVGPSTLPIGSWSARPLRASRDRERDGIAVVDPLGMLWGSSPRHDGRRTGGRGFWEVVTSMVGSQFRSAGPDWEGQAHDLFAHPPGAAGRCVALSPSKAQREHARAGSQTGTLPLPGNSGRAC